MADYEDEKLRHAVQGLRDRAPAAQVQALAALSKYGEEGATYADRVEKMLQSQEEQVVVAALNALSLMGTYAAYSVPSVATCLAGASIDIRLAALQALGKMQASSYVDTIAQCLSDPSPAVTCAACGAMECLGKDASGAAAGVAKVLTSQDPDAKAAALKCLGAMGDDALAHCSAICGCLQDEDVLVREAATTVFSKMSDASSLVPFAANLLSAKEGWARCAAATALGAAGEQASSSAPTIAKLLGDDFEDKHVAALSAACIGGKVKATMRMPRCAAAEALGKVGAEGWKFADEVAKLLADKSPEVKAVAAAALGAMGSAGAGHEAAVRGLFKDSDTRVAAAAIAAVGQMGQTLGGSGKESVDAVVKMLLSQQPAVRCSAAGALGSMGECVFPHIEKILKCFEDRCPQVKAAALHSLAAIGPRGQVYAANAARVIQDTWTLPSVRIAALDSLAGMEARGAAFAEEIAELLVDSEADVRAAAARTLGSFGMEALPLLSYVEEARSDPVASVRQAAAEASERICRG